MRVHSTLLTGAAAVALLSVIAAPALAQDASAAGQTPSPATSNAPAPDQPNVNTTANTAGPNDGPAGPNDQPQDTASAGAAGDELVVTGVRASLQSAQRIKQNASQIVDSIVASDIGKLPDVNTAEALQRVTGVQINTDLGEGSTVVVRGLSQVETLLNGRETFTASGTRSLNFEFIPAELLSAVDVYKTQSADLVEGGLGGTINVRTRMPFDFSHPVFSGSAMANYGTLGREVRPAVSGLVSDRWTTGAGEIGFLVSATYQERQLAEDYISAGAPLCYGAVVTGVCTTNTIGPNGGYNPAYSARRKRFGLDSVLQWRPNDSVELYVEANYNKFSTQQVDYGTYPLAGANPAAYLTNPTFFPNGYVKSGTWVNAPLRTLSVFRNTIDTQKQLSAGGKWTVGRLTLKGDASYLDTQSVLRYHELDLQTTVPSIDFDFGTSPASYTVNGANLLDPSIYHFAALTDSENYWKGHEAQFHVDGDFDVHAGPMTDIAFGARYASLGDKLTPIRYSNGGLGGFSASAFPGLIQQNPLGAAFTGSNVPQISDYLVADASQLRDLHDIFGAFGLAGYPPGVQSQGVYEVDEKDWAGYVKANFTTNIGIPVDGNIGIRWTRTSDDVSGTETIVGTPTTYLPINDHNSYSNWLPSVNVRAHLTDTLMLRAAYSKSVTRPEFSQLNPGLTLVPANFTGSQGNPDLLPFKANNYDLSLEWYFAHTGLLYGAAFYKTVTNFPFTRGVTVNINGDDYSISQPVNLGAAKIRGVEVGYQQFYTFLPGWLSGFGTQANVTYVDSSADTAIAGFRSSLPNLSRWSYNAIAMYEKGPLSARVAYSWRSSFVQSIASIQSVGTLPVESKAFGILDAAINYDVSPHLTLSLEGQNLLQAKHSTYYGSEFSPGQVYQDDRQILVGVRFKY